jgi:hypothetical protein
LCAEPNGIALADNDHYLFVADDFGVVRLNLTSGASIDVNPGELQFVPKPTAILRRTIKSRLLQRMYGAAGTRARDLDFVGGAALNTRSESSEMECCAVMFERAE